MSSRNNLRQQIRTRRQQLSFIEQQSAARHLAQNLCRLPVFQRSHHIAFYLANDGEIALDKLIETAWKRGKQCYLPILRGNSDKRLWFARYQPGDRLVYNRFMIPEPDVPSHQLIHAWSLDLLLLPLVAFDKKGNRLGMGGGYYDRTLAYLNRRQIWKKPRLFGVAHEFQKTASALPSRDWDIPLNATVTDKGVYTFS
ncbi:MAG: 5-formyltetrahydrofolate cyclo-ligase [Gammaproteobacteria bacterium]|nr:5-formyltetrahydrofolate cyclo-ligase [Gammaproteobacteria bacterium]MDH5593998.1 5-formyltetrahydrofolate cyclo-ligase [Gammaproteobacteria bacterium]MDH5613410.1 5-formyltetrahydrofolate cyclo-ligase [Gammaproteobacteria bacterium]